MEGVAGWLLAAVAEDIVGVAVEAGVSQGVGVEAAPAARDFCHNENSTPYYPG